MLESAPQGSDFKEYANWVAKFFINDVRGYLNKNKIKTEQIDLEWQECYGMFLIYKFGWLTNQQAKRKLLEIMDYKLKNKK